MPNNIKYQEGQSPLDENLRPLKVDDKPTAIETAEMGKGARITGDLEVTGSIPIVTTKQIESATDDVNIISVAGNIVFKPNSSTGNVNVNTATTTTIELDNGGNDGNPSIKLMSLLDTADYFKITTTASGATTITTVDDGAAVGHLTLDADGDIKLDSATGITHFYDAGDTDDAFKIIVTGGTGATSLQTVSDAADGHLDIIADGHIKFPSSGVGFRAAEAVFGASPEIEDGGNSTDIDFRMGNKFNLELGGNIDGSASSRFLNLIFPAVSGNFLLVLGQDGTGSRLVHSTAWRAYDSGESLGLNAIFANGTDGAIRWAGGSAPTLTTGAGKADIISIYWHADSETAFAVATLDF